MSRATVTLGFAVVSAVAFGGHGGDPAVVSDAGALADGFRATVLLPVLAFLIALRLPRAPLRVPVRPRRSRHGHHRRRDAPHRLGHRALVAS